MDKTKEAFENVRLDTELLSLTKRDDLILYSTADASEAITGMHRLYLDDGTKIAIVNHGTSIEKATDTSSNNIWWMLSTIKSGSDIVLRFRLKTSVGDTSTLPLKGDTVVVSSRAYRIQSVERISASGIDIIYNLQARI